MDNTTTEKETFDQWLNRIAEVKPWNAQGDENPQWIDMYVSRTDGGYLTFSNLTEDLRWLYQAGISEQLQKKTPDGFTCCIGFNPTEQKWYGWSHRAFFGYGIGHTITHESCGFHPSNEEEFAQNKLAWWGEDMYKKDAKVTPDPKGVTVSFTYSDEVPDEEMRGTESKEFFAYPETWGLGEWTAQTLEDAKQMAIDFAESVS